MDVVDKHKTYIGCQITLHYFWCFYICFNVHRLSQKEFPKSFFLIFARSEICSTVRQGRRKSCRNNQILNHEKLSIFRCFITDPKRVFKHWSFESDTQVIKKKIKTWLCEWVTCFPRLALEKQWHQHRTKEAVRSA